MLLLLLGGCPSAHSDYPGKSCKLQSDCFQGETCILDGESGSCVAGGDADGGTP